MNTHVSLSQSAEKIHGSEIYAPSPRVTPLGETWGLRGKAGPDEQGPDKRVLDERGPDEGGRRD